MRLFGNMINKLSGAAGSSTEPQINFWKGRNLKIMTEAISQTSSFQEKQKMYNDGGPYAVTVKIGDLEYTTVDFSVSVKLSQLQLKYNEQLERTAKSGYSDEAWNALEPWQKAFARYDASQQLGPSPYELYKNFILEIMKTSSKYILESDKVVRIQDEIN